MTPTERKLLDRIFEKEGGFVDHPADVGGPTNFGITQATLSRYRGEVSSRDVRKINKIDAEAIYLEDWIKPLRLGEVRQFDKAWTIFDCAVLFGQKRSVLWAQEATGVKQDGVIGPVTIKAINRVSKQRFIVFMLGLRMMRHASRCKEDPSQVVFLRGWTARALELLHPLVPAAQRKLPFLWL